MTTKWEYLEIARPLVMEDFAREEFEDVVEEIGAEGWELVTVVYVDYDEHLYRFYKRPR